MSSRNILLTKNKLVLIPIHGRDDFVIRTLIGWLNDKSIVRFSEQRHRCHTIESQWNYIQSFDHGPAFLGDTYWGIHAGETLVGSISYRIDRKNNVSDLGIMIGEKSKWGKGIGTEAWQKVMDYLFWGGVRKVEAGCMQVNTGMMAICQKTGMVEEGRKADHFLFEGGTTDLINWGKFVEHDEDEAI